MDFIQNNKLSHLHNNKDIFFCQARQLFSKDQALLESLTNIPNELILITANDDTTITDELVKKLPSNVKKWFACNARSLSNKVIGIPLGIESTQPCKVSGHGMAWPHAIEKPKIIEELNKNPSLPEKDAYANFSLRTNPERYEVLKICRDLDWVSSDDCGENVGPIKHSKHSGRIPYNNFASKIQHHKMVISPEGNGTDCHRTWEALYLNRVPIVKKSNELNRFSDLPILFIDHWEQLRDKEFILNEYEKVKNNSKTLLYCNYWINKILKEQQAIRHETTTNNK